MNIPNLIEIISAHGLTPKKAYEDGFEQGYKDGLKKLEHDRDTLKE